MAADIPRLIKEAAEAAKLVPKHLQEAAFNRAFEALLAAEQTPSISSSSKPSTEVEETARSSRSLEELDRTAHSEINHTRVILENALRLLRVTRRELQRDGLTATEIAHVLTNKFRAPASRRRVSRVLNEAGQYVDRRKEGKKVVFRLMGPGEEYLSSLSDDAGEAPSGSQPRPRKKGPPSKGRKKKSARAAEKKNRVGTSPAASMKSLLVSGFFSSPRKIGEIVNQLKHDQGRSFKSSELSPVLLRWLRSGKLLRSQNSKGQYEYISK